MVLSSFEWLIAMRYLRARRSEGFISVIAWFSLLGIALGVATLIIVMSVMNGFRQELLGRILGLNGHISVYAEAGGFTDYDDLAAAIRDLRDVTAVYPIVEGQVMVTHRGSTRGAVVRGVRMADLRQRPILADNINLGTLDNPDEGLVIGQRLAEQMAVTVGDELSIISPQGRVTAFGSVPRVGTFPVAAIFEVGMYEYDSSFVFMPIEMAQAYFQFPGAASALEVFLTSPDRAPSLVPDLYRVLGDRGGRILEWQRANAGFFNAIQVERNVMFLILTLIILVAAFNVISSLIMLVKDKGRDIAILRTMGATRGMIMRVFLISGASIGVIGTTLGFVIGLTLAQNIEVIRQWIQGMTGTELFAAEIYFLSQLPAEVDPTEVATVVAMALGLSFLATLYPSWRAARIDPAEALRYE
ncbi:MAG: lipoprotein-releasing ABC transporter permease subunit [Rhodospirillales bacterium]|nr:MAG: lipoprotein-releasing ABC transporter permease subunit [Rhodospirillales bacterium]